MDEKFNKAERLGGKKQLATLFKNGKAVKAYPFILLYLPASFAETVPGRVAISIPKKRVRKAVNRNRIRRQVREAYRKNKHILKDSLQEVKQQYAMLIIFVGSEDTLESILIHQKITRLLTRLSKDVGQSDQAEKDHEEQTN